MPHSVGSAVGPKRRSTFVAWVVASIVVTAYLLVAAPFAEYFHEAHWAVAVALPALMAFFLITGLGWLLYLVSARRPRGDGRPPFGGEDITDGHRQAARDP
jgi:hypothetical protein